MLSTFTLATALLAAVSSAVPTENHLETRQVIGSPCKDVHIFLAKGWNEPYPGRQGKLTGAICYGLDSCDYEDIQWENDASINYCTAVTQGKRNGLKQVEAYATRCPNSKLVLSGYSQGANVIGDMLGGGKGKFGTPSCFIKASKALDPATFPGNKIGAALLFGDTRHAGDQSFNVLNGSAYDSQNRRYAKSLANLNKFADKLQSYCDSTDSVCAGNGPGPFLADNANHLNYFDRYTDEAAGWVKYILGY